MTAPHEVVWNLAQAVVPSRALSVVSDLGVADAVPDCGASAGQLAAHCGVDADALDRVLKLLCAHGIFEHDGSLYRHNPPSWLLCTDHPQSMRAFARLNGLPVASAAITALDHAVRTGRPGVETVDPGGFFAYLGQHADEAVAFGTAMMQKARADIADLLAAYDFRPFRTIADIGGGRGHLLEAVLGAAPQARGVLFDLPSVIGEASRASSRTSAWDRVTPQAGDFFCDPLPGADLYLVMEIIHDWADREAKAILGAIRRAAEPGATVLIVEHIAPDDGIDLVSQTLDVLMLTVTGGLERTPAALGDLLCAAGFAPGRLIRTNGPISALEAVAV